MKNSLNSTHGHDDISQLTDVLRGRRLREEGRTSHQLTKGSYDDDPQRAKGSK